MRCASELTCGIGAVFGLGRAVGNGQGVAAVCRQDTTALEAGDGVAVQAQIQVTGQDSLLRNGHILRQVVAASSGQRGGGGPLFVDNGCVVGAAASLQPLWLWAGSIGASGFFSSLTWLSTRVTM